MSINPPSDIVLDVARAADPARSVEAAERLARLGGNSTAAETGFSNVLGGLPSPASSAADLRTQLELQSEHPHTAVQPLDAQTKAYRSFEALIFQNLVQNILPDSEEFFGEGTAGMIWKSMLADQLGTDLAKKVDIGIGPKHLFKTHAAALGKPDPLHGVVPAVAASLPKRS